MLNDYNTTQNIYVKSYDVANRQAFLQPNNPGDTKDQSTISIDKIAFIVYSTKPGAQPGSCD